MSDWVCLKYTGGDSLSIYAKPLRPFEFRPYLRVSVADYVTWKALFEYTGQIEVVSEKEYAEWADAVAAAAAILYFCGDYGGCNKKGEFCGRRVDGVGCRCEHHGGRDSEQQGHYEATGWPRPEYAR